MTTILDSFGNPAALPPRASASIRGWSPGGYNAAAWSPDRARITNAATDSSRDITPFTRGQIDRIARYLCKNNGMIKGLKLDFVKYVIGPGIFPYADSGDEGWDEAADEWFMDWAEICDISGRMSFWGMQRARESNRFESGDVFTILTQKPSGYPQLKLVRPHNVRSDGEDGYNDGIKVDRHGASQRFKFLQPDGTYRTLPARSVDHSMMMEAGDEVRQVSALHAAIEHCQDSAEILGFEKLAIKDHSRVSRVIKKDYNGYEDEDDGSDVEAQLEALAGGSPRDMSSVPYEKVVGGEIIRLNTGEDMSSFASDRPGTAFSGFLELLGREVTASTGWRYEFSWNPTGIPGTAIRQILDSISRTALLRQTCEIRSTHRLRNYAIANAIERGELDPHPNWYRADYIPGAPDPSIDKGRDGKLEMAQVEAGLLSRKEFHGRRGKSWRRVEAQILKETERTNSNGLDPESPNVAVDNTEAKTKVDAYGIGVRAGVITPQEDDENYHRDLLGLPSASNAVKNSWEEDGGARRPITITAQDEPNTESEPTE